MGLIRRHKSSDKLIGGSRLNVPGQGVFSIKKSPNDIIPIKKIGDENPRPTPTPTPNITPTSTPTPSITPTSTQIPTPTPTPTQTQPEICYLSTEFLDPIIAENLDNLIVDCP